MSEITTIRTLLQQRLQDQLTAADREQLTELLKDPARQEEFQTVLQELMTEGPLLADSRPGWDNRIDVILNLDREVAPSRVMPVTRGRVRKIQWAAAAAIVLILATGTWYWQHSTRKATAPIATTTAPHDLPPGTNRATLTINGAMNIILDSSTNGSIVQQGGSDAVKQSSGHLVYQASPLTKDEPPSYHTLSTPRGGQYQLTLPDGSRVWLNAASSITYPTAFTGKERKVTVTGEAYFEIAPDKALPFIVHSGTSYTTVLGTRFNVNAYSDEALLQVTLLDGAVKYSTGGQEKILHPGEQAAYDPVAGKLSLRQADTTQAVAWKNGQFEFDNRDLATILRQVSRWYDVDIHYKQSPGPEKFGGGISRQLPLSSVLKLLENNGVHFELNGHQLTVIPSP